MIVREASSTGLAVLPRGNSSTLNFRSTQSVCVVWFGVPTGGPIEGVRLLKESVSCSKEGGRGGQGGETQTVR